MGIATATTTDKKKIKVVSYNYTQDIVVKYTQDKVVNCTQDMVVNYTQDKVVNCTQDMVVKYTQDKVVNCTQDIVKYTQDKVVNYTQDKVVNYTQDIVKYTQDKVVNRTQAKIVKYTQDKVVYCTQDMVTHKTTYIVECWVELIHGWKMDQTLYAMSILPAGLQSIGKKPSGLDSSSGAVLQRRQQHAMHDMMAGHVQPLHITWPTFAQSVGVITGRL